MPAPPGLPRPRPTWFTPSRMPLWSVSPTAPPDDLGQRAPLCLGQLPVFFHVADPLKHARERYFYGRVQVEQLVCQLGRRAHPDATRGLQATDHRADLAHRGEGAFHVADQ